MNEIVLAGVVQKLWGRGNDVFARLRISTRGNIEEKEDSFASYINMRFPDGGVQGEPVSLSPGTLVRVIGYSTHTRYTERILKFLDAASATDFLGKVPEDDLAAWRNIHFVRRNSMFNVLGLQLTGTDVHLGMQMDSKKNNEVSLEGIVAKVWEYPYSEGTHIFARIACYDKWTPITPGKDDKLGRPHRKPHYLTVKLNDGKAGKMPVELKKKMRVRITGVVEDQGMSVTLRDNLLDTGSEEVIALMGRLLNSDQLSEIVAQQSSVHIRVSSLIVYSAPKKRLNA